MNLHTHATAPVCFLTIAEKRQNHEKQVDDVEVQIEGGKHVVVDGKLKLFVLSANDQLSVVDKVEAENENAEARVGHFSCAAAKYCCEEAKDDERQQRGKEVGAHSCKIVFRLKRKASQSEDYARSHSERDHDSVGFVRRRYAPDEKCFREGKKGQENHILGIRAGIFCAASEAQDGHEVDRDGQVKRPRVRNHVRLYVAGKNKEAYSRSGHQYLKQQNTIHFANKPLTDVLRTNSKQFPIDALSLVRIIVHPVRRCIRVIAHKRVFFRRIHCDANNAFIFIIL